MTETFYDCLGVPEDATTAEIEDAYREAVKEVHPDVNDDADAGVRTKRLNRARDVLTDADDRARYDRLGHAAYTGETAASGPPTGADAEAADGSGAGASARAGPGDDGSAGRGPSRAATNQGRGRRAQRDADVAGTDSSVRGGGTTQSQSAQRQAAAGASAGSNADGSWNAWDSTRGWAVRQASGGRSGFDVERLFPTEQSLLIVGAMLLVYPLLVASSLYPPFPLVARLTVGACVLCLLVYMISLPEIGLFVFGTWGVVATLGILAVPWLSALSVVGLVALAATWIPLGLAVLVLLVVGL